MTYGASPSTQVYLVRFSPDVLGAFLQDYNLARGRNSKHVEPVQSHRITSTSASTQGLLP